MLLVVVLWAANVSLVKGALSTIPPLPFTAVRFASASLLLTGLVYWRSGGWQAPREYWWKLVWLGIVGNTIYQYFFINGLARTSAANTAMIMGTNPAFVALLGGLIGIEQITRRTILGIAAAVVGIVIVMLARGAGLSRQTLPGDLLMLSGVLCWAIYGLGIRTLAGRIPSLQATTLTLLTGTPGLLVLGWPQGRQLNWLALPGRAWLGLCYSVIFGLIVCYVLYNYSVQRIGNVRTSLYGCLIPLLATLLAWPLLGERPTLWHGVGGAFIIGGVLLSRRP